MVSGGHLVDLKMRSRAQGHHNLNNISFLDSRLHTPSIQCAEVVQKAQQALSVSSAGVVVDHDIQRFLRMTQIVKIEQYKIPESVPEIQVQ